MTNHSRGDSKRSLKNKLFSLGLGVGMGVVSIVSPLTTSAGENMFKGIDLSRQEQVEERKLEDYLLTQEEMDKYGVELVKDDKDENPYIAPKYRLEEIKKSDPEQFKGVKNIMLVRYKMGPISAKYNLMILALETESSTRAKEIRDEGLIKSNADYCIQQANYFISIGIPDKKLNKQEKYLKLLHHYFQERKIEISTK